jgi:hypothetical protein
MEPIVSLRQLAAASKTFARRLLIARENRLELLTMETRCHWETLSASLDQLRKNSACLEKSFS